MSKELGTLIVVVLKARNLNDKHSFYKQDVFAQVSLNGVNKRTPVDVKGGQHPVWDAEIRFPVMKETSEKYRKLEVSCWAKEPRTDDILGQGTVDITETLRTGEFDDWVTLDVNGVARGELYLEMTYYTNSPTPATLAVTQNGGLSRRPSKLSPSNRLSRPYTPPESTSSSPQRVHSPHYSPRPEQNQSSQRPGSPNRTHLLPPSPSSSRSSSPKDRITPLPSLPEESASRNSIPNVLAPGGLRLKPQPQSQSPPQIPSFLRPGNPGSSPTPILRPSSAEYVRHPSTSPPPEFATPPHGLGYSPVAGPPLSGYNGDSPRPQTSIGYSPAPISAYTGPPSTGPELWRANDSLPPSFPVAMVSPAHDDYSSPSNRPEPSSLPHRPTNNTDLPDPYLQARYKTPLPLPGSTSPPYGRQTPPQQNSSVDAARIHELRLAEKEAARRKEQEEKDLELARQLDRELNLG